MRKCLNKLANHENLELSLFFFCLFVFCFFFSFFFFFFSKFGLTKTYVLKIISHFASAPYNICLRKVLSVKTIFAFVFLEIPKFFINTIKP